MRGQASIELFFAMTLFVLVVFWLNYFYGLAASSGVSELRGQRVLAESLASAASDACASGVAVSVALPCLVSPSRQDLKLQYAVSFGGTEATVSSALGAASAGALCRLSGPSVAAACGNTVLCLAPLADSEVKASEGACR